MWSGSRSGVVACWCDPPHRKFSGVAVVLGWGGPTNTQEEGWGCSCLPCVPEECILGLTPLPDPTSPGSREQCLGITSRMCAGKYHQAPFVPTGPHCPSSLHLCPLLCIPQCSLLPPNSLLLYPHLSASFLSLVGFPASLLASVPSPTLLSFLLSVSLSCPCRDATLSSLFPPHPSPSPFPPSLSHTWKVSKVSIAAPTPIIPLGPWYGPRAGSAHSLCCSGVQKGASPAKKKDRERYSGSNPSPPWAGGRDCIWVLGRGSSSPVDSQKAAVNQDSLGVVGDQKTGL